MSATVPRGPLYADYRGPGPLAYTRKTTVGTNEHCLTKHCAPAYSVGIRRPVKRSDIPGPNSCHLDAYITNRGRQIAPSFSVQGRHPTRGIEVGPGPGSYNAHMVRSGVLSKERTVPRLSLGDKSRYSFKDEAPPPNTYVIRRDLVGQGSATRREAPHWSLYGRSLVGGSHYDRIKASVPGPASYKATDPSVTKIKSASYTMLPRTRQKNYNSAKSNPGPGAYSTQMTASGQGFSMGTRHSQYTVPLIVELDVM